MDGVRSGAEERVRILGAEAAEREARTNGVERELRLEREWRTSLQETSISNTEKISQLHQEIDQLKRVSEVHACDQYCLLRIPWRINLTVYLIAYRVVVLVSFGERGNFAETRAAIRSFYLNPIPKPVSMDYKPAPNSITTKRYRDLFVFRL